MREVNSVKQGFSKTVLVDSRGQLYIKLSNGQIVRVDEKKKKKGKKK